MDGDICVIGVLYREEFTSYPEKVEFYRVNLATEKIQRLPLTINGAFVREAVVFPDGRIFFTYYSGPVSGSGMYQLPQTDNLK